MTRYAERQKLINPSTYQSRISRILIRLKFEPVRTDDSLSAARQAFIRAGMLANAVSSICGTYQLFNSSTYQLFFIITFSSASSEWPLVSVRKRRK